MSQNPWVAVDAATIPAKRARELRDAWEDFVDGRGLDDEDPGTPQIRDPIADSWLRSRDAGVDPTRPPARAVGRRARGRRATCGTTTRSRSPRPLIDECMALASVEADHLTVVSDADGMLLSIRGDTRLRNRAADDMNFVEGALWSEAGAGTNAVGTAIAAAHAVQVFAAEHFTEPVQRWTCAAAPVHRPGHGRAARHHRPHRRHRAACTRTASRSSSRPRAAIEELLQRGCTSATTACARATAACCDPDRRRRARDPQRPRPARPRPEHWSLGGRRRSRAGGGLLVLPVGRSRPSPSRSRTATPISCARARRARAGGCGPCSSCASSARRAERRPRRPPVQLRRRHVELLTLLHPAPRAGRAPTCCATSCYGDDGHPASIRVEMSRLRKLLARRHRPARLRPRSATWTATLRHVARAARPQRDRRRRRGVSRPAPAVLRRARASAASARSSRAGCARRS